MFKEAFRPLILTTLVAAFITFTASVALAQSAKTAISMGGNSYERVGITNNAMPWTEVYSAGIMTAQGSELLVGLSLECGIYTQTEVKGQKGDKATASAEASVMARVWIADTKNGEPSNKRLMYPPQVTFCARQQTLTAKLGGVLESCETAIVVDETGEGTATFNKDDCEFTDEEINLMLNTMSATHFNFIAPNVQSNNHEITVEILVSQQSGGEVVNDVSDRTGDYGSASAWGVVGYGALVVDEVKLVKDSGGTSQ